MSDLYAEECTREQYWSVVEPDGNDTDWQAIEVVAGCRVGPGTLPLIEPSQQAAFLVYWAFWWVLFAAVFVVVWRTAR